MSPKVSWFLFNIPIYAALIVGFVYGITGLQNIALFAIWLIFGVTLMVLIPGVWDNLVQKVANETRRGLPQIVRNTLSIATLVFLVWYGAFLTAVVYMITVIITQGINAAVKKKRLEKAGVSPEMT